MSSLTFLAGGVDISSYVQMDTVEGQNDLTARIDVLRFTTQDAPLGATTDKQDVIVHDEHGTVWFGGIVGYNTPKSETKSRLVDVEVQGYAALLDTALVNKVYNQQADAQIIADLLANYRPEITLAPVPGGAGIQHVAFPYKYLSHCLDTICQLTGFKYYVAPDKTLHYFSPSSLSPVLTFTDTSPDGVSSYSYEQWQIQSDSTQIQNRVTVIGGDFLAPAITDSFTGDGATTTFNLAHRPNQMQSITVGGVVQGIGHLGIDQYGGSSAITVLVDDANQQIDFQTAPGSGQSIQATYDYHTPIIARVQNQQSYSQYSNRWYDGYVSDATLLSVSDALTRGNTVLGQYSYAQKQAKFRTRAPWTRSGQLVNLINQVDGINGQFLIQANLWRLKGNGIITQDMTLIG